MAWLERVETWAPGWAMRAKRRHWLNYFTSLAGTVDGLFQVMHEAALASMPGQTDDPKSLLTFSSMDALELLGRDRLVLRGLAETVASYAAALRRFRAQWASATSVPELLDQIARILGPDPPRVRIVNGRGEWWTREADGTFFLQTNTERGLRIDPDGTTSPDESFAHPWDWDSLSGNPPPPGWNDPSRFWVIIYAPCNDPYLAGISGTIGDGRFIGEGKGTSEAATIGTTSPTQHVELIRAIIEMLRAAGFRCSHVIVSFDPDAFNPTSDSTPTSIPDGWWGWCVKEDSGAYVSSRFPNARYWPAEPGGIAGSGS